MIKRQIKSLSYKHAKNTQARSKITARSMMRVGAKMKTPKMTKRKSDPVVALREIKLKALLND